MNERALCSVERRSTEVDRARCAVHDTLDRSLTLEWPVVVVGKLRPHPASAVICDKVEIDSQSLIVCGVHIGDMAVVAANSVLRDDGLSRAMVGGIPVIQVSRVAGEGDSGHLVFDREAPRAP